MSSRSSKKSKSPVNVSHIPDEVLVNEIMSRLPDIADIKSMSMVNKGMNRVYNQEKDKMYSDRLFQEFGVTSKVDAYDLLNTIMKNYTRLHLNTDRMRDYITEMHIKNIASLDLNKVPAANFDVSHALNLLAKQMLKLKNKATLSKYICFSHTLLKSKEQHYIRLIKNSKSFPLFFQRILQVTHTFSVDNDKDVAKAMEWIHRFEAKLLPFVRDVSSSDSGSF